jgi:hypothetical protein
MRRIASTLPAWVPSPFPAQMLLGLDALKWEVQQQFPAFLRGRSYRGSEWDYYPYALLVKVPIGTLALIALAAIMTLRTAVRRHRVSINGTLPVWIYAGCLLVGTMVLADVDLGVRYILPVLPFAFVACGRLWKNVAGMSMRDWPKQAIVASGLVVLTFVETVAAAPRFIPFFNVLAGGSTGGYLKLNDSNFDWGQGLLDLKQWMTDHGVQHVHLGYFGRTDPAIYGIAYTPLNQPCADDYVVISGYYLAGLAHRMPTSKGPTGFVQIDFAEELRDEEPVAIVGKVFYVYRRAAVAHAFQLHRMR